MYNTSYARVNPTVVKVVITPDGETKKSIPMVILDVSGSMAGSRLNHCLGALRCFMEKGPIRLITFNDQARYLGQVEQLPFIEAGGGTSFRKAFETLNKSEHIGPVIFMTDGEDGDGFKSHSFPSGIQLFTVGIEGDSKTQLLIELAKNSPVPGDYTFFSSKNNNYAAEAELLSTKVRSAPILFQGKEYYLADRLELYLEDTTTDCPTSSTALVDYLAYRVDQLVQKGEKAPLDKIKALRDEATELFASSGKLPLILRKQIRSSLQPVYALLGKFYDLRHANMKISNEQLANLALSARDARTSRFAKLAVDRAAENEEKISKQDQRLAELAAALDPSTVDLDQQCILSCSSVGDLMKEGDCLGVGIQCVPSEVCIADPTRLKLTDVSTSYFGCNQFLEASEWALGNGVTFGQASKIVPDSSRVNVSAVLPLYLSPTHWQFAKEHLLRMVGHACCKDPLQGTLRHIVFTYLMAYAKAKTYHDEFHKSVAQEFALVVRNLPNILPTPEEFCSVQRRVTDSVPSFELLEVAWEILGFERPAHYQAMKEEELLRREKQPRSLLCFPGEWISSYVAAHCPLGQGDLYVALRAKALESKRHEILAKLPSADQTEKDLPKFVECATSVDPTDVPLSQGSAKRRALIALQAWSCPKSTDLANYISYHDWSEEQVEQAWKEYCDAQLHQQRSAALTAQINAANASSVEKDLVFLRTASLLEWLGVLTRNLYVGRNITRYASVATDIEHVKMLSGRYDLGPLLQVPSFPVATLNDTLTSWVPSTSKKRHGALWRSWLAKWGVDLLRVFPQVALRSNSVFLADLFQEKAPADLYAKFFDATTKDQCAMFHELLGLPKISYWVTPNLDNTVFQLKKRLEML